jgi:hypothetical protein
MKIPQISTLHSTFKVDILNNINGNDDKFELLPFVDATTTTTN